MWKRRKTTYPFDAPPESGEPNLNEPEPQADPLWPWEGEYRGMKLADIPGRAIADRLASPPGSISVRWRARLEDEKAYRSGKVRK